MKQGKGKLGEEAAARGGEGGVYYRVNIPLSKRTRLDSLSRLLLCRFADRMGVGWRPPYYAAFPGPGGVLFRVAYFIVPYRLEVAGGLSSGGAWQGGGRCRSGCV